MIKEYVSNKMRGFCEEHIFLRIHSALTFGLLFTFLMRINHFQRACVLNFLFAQLRSEMVSASLRSHYPLRFVTVRRGRPQLG